MKKNNNKSLLNMLDLDIYATDVYTLEYKKNPNANLDYTTPLIII